MECIGLTKEQEKMLVETLDRSAYCDNINFGIIQKVSITKENQKYKSMVYTFGGGFGRSSATQEEAFTGLLLGCLTAIQRHVHYMLSTAKNKESFVIIDSHIYSIREETNSFWKGFGGRKFHIRFHSGEEVITTNLWHNGEVSKNFKSILPNNAVFVNEKKWVDISGTQKLI